MPRVPVFGTQVLGSLGPSLFLDFQPLILDFQILILARYSFSPKSFQYYRILLTNCY